MQFRDLFREQYRKTLLAARANNQKEVLDGLIELRSLFTSQYSLPNGDTIIVKVELEYWQEIFNSYIEIIQQNGLNDSRVQKLFGLKDGEGPSFADILSGNGEVKAPSLANTINIAGIVPPIEHSDPPKPSSPIEPVSPVPTTTPIALDNYLNIRADEPDSLENFIGQQHIVKTLLKEIAIAKNKGQKYLDNILLFGNQGLGKSTLMRLIAKALNARFEWMDCSQYRNSQQSLKALQNFLLRIARENVPTVIALDEIHMLSNELQSSLLTLLNSRIWISPPDLNGNTKRIPIENFTFIGATTDNDKVLKTIKDRCLRLKFEMTDYTADELKLIYKNKVAAKGLTITDEAIETSIPRSRGSIRYVNAFIDGFDQALHNDCGKRVSTNIDLAVVTKYFEEKGIDVIGLEKKDLEILRAIAQDASGAIGVESLSARVGLDAKKYQSEFERHLIKIGFITVIGKGRCLTEKAINHLKGDNDD